MIYPLFGAFQLNIWVPIYWLCFLFHHIITIITERGLKTKNKVCKCFWSWSGQTHWHFTYQCWMKYFVFCLSIPFLFWSLQSYVMPTGHSVREFKVLRKWSAHAINLIINKTLAADLKWNFNNNKIKSVQISKMLANQKSHYGPKINDPYKYINHIGKYSPINKLATRHSLFFIIKRTNIKGPLPLPRFYQIIKAK